MNVWSAGQQLSQHSTTAIFSETHQYVPYFYSFVSKNSDLISSSGGLLWVLIAASLPPFTLSVTQPLYIADLLWVTLCALLPHKLPFYPHYHLLNTQTYRNTHSHCFVCVNALSGISNWVMNESASGKSPQGSGVAVDRAALGLFLWPLGWSVH